MGERKWFQVKRNKISSYICVAVLPMALVGACPGQQQDTVRGSDVPGVSLGCSWDVSVQWWGYKATAEGSKALCGTWTWVLCIKPWALALPVAELF